MDQNVKSITHANHDLNMSDDVIKKCCLCLKIQRLLQVSTSPQAW